MSIIATTAATMAGQALLSMIKELPNIIREAGETDLISASQVARVEPITLIDQGLITHPAMTDLAMCLTNIFAGYYLQAVQLNCAVGKIDVVGLLDRFNPQRSTSANVGAAVGGVMSAFARNKGAFNGPKNFKLPDPAEEDKVEAFRPTENGLGRDTVKGLSESVSLSVGKMLELNLESEGHHVTIPVAVRLIANTVAQESLVAILGIGATDNSLKERYYQWKAGDLRFFQDLILCQDLIDDYKQNAIKDKSGAYMAIINRGRSNALSAALSGKMSVGGASNIVVISETTKKNIENKYFGKMSDYKFRQRLFDNTYTMILAILDPSWDHVTFYYRGIRLGTEVKTSELKTANRNGGPDISEILKAYQLGNAPKL